MESKKSQIGATLTWFVAIFLIIFMMIIFVFIVSLMGGSKWFGSNDNNGEIRKYDADPILFSNFITFLNTPIVFKDKKITYFDAISSSLESKDKIELGFLIKKELDNYCSKYILLIPQGILTEKGFEDGYSMNGLDKNTGQDYWSMVISYKIIYREKNFEVLYRQLKSCGGEEIKNE